MPFDGSGNYIPAPAPNFPAIAGSTISAAYFNNVINDIAAALSNCLTRDGQGRPSGSINWNGKSLNNVDQISAVTVTASGSFSANSGTIAGNLTAATLTLTGALSGTTATFTGSLSANSLTLSAPLPVAQGGTGVTTSTGTGSVVLSTNPSITGAVTIRGASGNGGQVLLNNSGNTLISGTLDVDASGHVRLFTNQNNTNLTIGQISGTGGIISVFTNALERVRVTASGNVGIGTISPGSGTLLNVAGRGLFTAGAFDPFDSTASGVSISYDIGNNIGIVAAIQTGVSIRQLQLYGNPIVFLAGTGLELARLTASGTLAVGSTGSDFSRSWRFVANQSQNATSQFGFVNNDSGASAVVNLARITGLANNFCDWSLANNGGSPQDSYNYGSAVTAVRWLFNSQQALRLNSDGSIISANRSDAVGYKGLPVSSQTAGSLITLALSDMGQLVKNTLGGWAIPANSVVSFPVGTTIVLYNDSGSNQTVSITSDTLRLMGSSTTGTRTVAQRGTCTLVKIAATEWVASGAVT